jgi:hypothetical protein
MINKTAMACTLLGAVALVTGSFPSQVIARDNQFVSNTAVSHDNIRKTGTANLLAWDFDDNYGYDRGYNPGYGYGSGYGTYRAYTRYGVSDYSPGYGYGYNTKYVPVYSNDYGYGYGRQHGARGLVNDILNRIR